MNKQQLLSDLAQNTYCRVGPSKIQGIGVIAIRDIPKGTDIFRGSFEGDSITCTKQEIETLPKGVQNMLFDYLIPEGDNFFVPECGLNGIDISYFLNHSETPNVASYDDYETFVTTQDVTEGEELTYAYPEEKKLLMATTDGKMEG